MSREEWIRKLTSRKLWLAVAGFVSGLLLAFGKGADTAEKIAGLILQGGCVLSYILAEGWRDVASTAASVGNEHFAFPTDAVEAQLPEGLTVNVKKEDLEE